MNKIITMALILFFSSVLPLLSQSNEKILRDILSEKRSSEKEKFQKDSKADTTRLNKEYRKSQKKQNDKKNNAGKNSSAEDFEQPLPEASTPEKVILETGINLYNSNNFSSAVEKLNELITNSPNSIYKDQALTWKARSHIKLGDRDSAVKELAKISKDSGEYPSAIYTTGLLFMKNKDYDRAIPYLYKSAHQFPDHELADNALLNLSKIYLRQGKGGPALGSTLKLISLYPGRETEDDAYFILAKIFEKDPFLKDFEKARQVYKKFIHKAEKDKEINFATSPLLKIVKKNLFDMERDYFNK